MNKTDREHLGSRIEVFFKWHQLEKRIVSNKNKLKEIYGIKLGLVDVIKAKDALHIEMEKQFTSTHQSITDASNENDENAIELNNPISIRDCVGLFRPKTPDLNHLKKSTKNPKVSKKNNGRHSKENHGLNTFNASSNGTKFALSGRNKNTPSEPIERDTTPQRDANLRKKTVAITATPIMNSTFSKRMNGINNKQRKSFAINKSFTINGKQNTQNDHSKSPMPTLINNTKARNQNKKKNNDKDKAKAKANENNNDNQPHIATEDSTNKKQPLIDYINNKSQGIVKCSCNAIQALNICLQSNYLIPKAKIEIILSSIELYNLNKKMLKDHLESLISNRQSQLNELNEKLSHYDNTIIDKQFSPSKTATNGLNFITKEEENKMQKQSHAIQIINIFKTIFIMINEPFEHIEDGHIISYLFNLVLLKHNSETLKSLLLNVLGKKIECSNENIIKLIEFNHLNSKLFSAIELIKLNRSVSYMNFILKEYFEYLTFKFGESLYVIKSQMKERDALQAKVNELKVPYDAIRDVFSHIGLSIYQ